MTLYYIRQLAIIAKELDSHELNITIDLLLAKWKIKLTSLPITTNKLIHKQCSLYYILENNEWIPVHTAKENNQQGLMWTIHYKDGHSESGISRIGRWAHIDAMNLPNIDLSIKDLLLANKNYLK